MRHSPDESAGLSEGSSGGPGFGSTGRPLGAPGVHVPSHARDAQRDQKPQGGQPIPDSFDVTVAAVSGAGRGSRVAWPAHGSRERISPPGCKTGVSSRP